MQNAKGSIQNAEFRMQDGMLNRPSEGEFCVPILHSDD
jgi:hypothetical protein